MDEQNLDWLIRDNGNHIRGPIKHAEVLQLLKKGHLKGKTEIARANSYWFAVEEKAEVARFFPELGDAKGLEQPTQMTATLTEADVREHPLEPTQVLTKTDNQIEWLSDEFAEEFGGELAALSPESTTPSLELTTPVNQLGEVPEGASQQEKEDILRRATVKADTLPSELHDYTGERPRPLDDVIRQQARAGAAAPGPVAAPTPKMVDMENTNPDLAGPGRFPWAALVGGGALIAALVGVAVWAPAQNYLRARAPKPAPVRTVRTKEELTSSLRRSILLFDLEGAKDALADLELDPATRGELSTSVAQAIVKKEFLYDVEGALLALQTARAAAKGRRNEAEIDNLVAIYGFDREAPASLETFRRNLEAFRDDPVFRYNHALAQLRSGKAAEAVAEFEGLSTAASEAALGEDAAFGFGWALETQCARAGTCKRSNEGENAFQRALGINPNSAKARLGLALARLRHGGARAAEADFRAFLDAAPELDPPTRVMNYRKLGNGDFYNYAHNQIVELNAPGQSVSRPSPVIMAADAVVSAIQGRTSEAGKILESALSVAPGDANVLKAVGYLRWKEGKLDEAVEAVRDIHERGSFAINLLLGKAYLKLRRRDLAERAFRALVEAYPLRSEGHALLGDFLLDQPERAAEAKTELMTALKRDSTDLVALRGLTRLDPPLPLPIELQKNLPF